MVFREYLRQKWIDLRQTRTKVIIGPFYTYRRLHLAVEMLRFCDICFNRGGGHVAAATWQCTYVCFTRRAETMH